MSETGSKDAKTASGVVRGRILVIDDVPDLVTMVAKSLSVFGYEVLQATSGTQGIEVFSENSVDLVICDLHMPDFDGLAVSETVKEICEQKSIAKPPFLIITGWGDEIDSDEELARVGVDGILNKPIDVPELVEIIGELLGS
ncbi:response regulator [Thermodesulfobacteriota bacterium]